MSATRGILSFLVAAWKGQKETGKVHVKHVPQYVRNSIHMDMKTLLKHALHPGLAETSCWVRGPPRAPQSTENRGATICPKPGDKDHPVIKGIQQVMSRFSDTWGYPGLGVSVLTHAP